MISRIAYIFTIIFICSCADPGAGIVRFGNYKNRPRGFLSVYMPGGQIALYIPNNLNVPSTIVNVRFYIGKKGDYTKPFGLKIYSRDSITDKPGKEILKEPVIIDNVEKSGWHVVNLDDYKLDFPAGGIFVSMEWIPDSNFNELSQSECQFLAYSRTDNENNTWYCALGINWYQLPNVNFNAMIAADIKKRGLNKAN